jgi:hypothetical protein
VNTNFAVIWYAVSFRRFRTERSLAQAEPQKKHLLSNQPFRLIACLPRPLTPQRLADGNLGQANILHHGPHDGQAARFGREGVDLIGALPHIAKQAQSAHWCCECSGA